MNMTSYYDFLIELNKLKEEPVSPYRKATFLYWKTIVGKYQFTLKHQKSRLKSNKMIDFHEDFNKNLTEFFGVNDIKAQEKMLGVLRRKLKEIGTSQQCCGY